jgi:hypothetical protein
MPIGVFLDIAWKRHFVCNLEDFDFLLCGLRACEDALESGVVRASAVPQRVPKSVELVFLLQELETQVRPQNTELHSEQQSIAACFLSTLSANFCAGTPRGFASAKTKLHRLSLA